MTAAMSKIWAHVGTLLAFVGAIGGDTGAFHLHGTDVALAVNVVAGVLVACHLLSPATVGAVVSTVGRVVADIRRELALTTGAYKAAADAAHSATPTSATTAVVTSTTPPPA